MKPEPPAPSTPRFDRAAPRYDAHAEVQRVMAAWLAEWAPHRRAGRALEIGAGTGLFTAHLLPWSGHLLATDLSPAMVAAGRQRFPQIPWAVREAGEAGSERYDWIFSCSFLQWSTDPDTLLETWRDQLNPGGRVLAGFFVDGALPVLHRLLGPDAPLPSRGADAWKALFRRAGFRIHAAETRDDVHTYRSALDLFRHLHRIGATAAPRLSASQMKGLLRAYESECRRPEGGVEGTWRYCRLLTGD